MQRVQPSRSLTSSRQTFSQIVSNTIEQYSELAKSLRVLHVSEHCSQRFSHAMLGVGGGVNADAQPKHTTPQTRATDEYINKDILLARIPKETAIVVFFKDCLAIDVDVSGNTILVLRFLFCVVRTLLSYVFGITPVTALVFVSPTWI
jgi:hypothetical protein